MTGIVSLGKGKTALGLVHRERLGYEKAVVALFIYLSYHSLRMKARLNLLYTGGLQ